MSTIIEQLGSRSFTLDSDKRTATQTLLFYKQDNDAEYTVPDVRKDLDIQGYVLGARFVDDRSLGLTSIDISPNDSRSYTWEVTLQFETGTNDDDDDTGGEFEIGPVSTNITTRVELIDVWRTNPKSNAAAVGDDVSGTDPDGVESVGEDVGGNSADTAGSPLSFPLALLDMVYVENTEQAPNFIELSSLVGCRNDDTWAGAPRGTVIYKGSSSTYQRNGFYQVTHNFTADLVFSHRRQLAEGSPETGGPDLADENTANENSAANASTFDDTGTPPEGAGTTKKGSAKRVVWVQRFTRFCDFSNDIYVHNPFGAAGSNRIHF